MLCLNSKSYLIPRKDVPGGNRSLSSPGAPWLQNTENWPFTGSSSSASRTVAVIDLSSCHPGTLAAPLAPSRKDDTDVSVKIARLDYVCTPDLWSAHTEEPSGSSWPATTQLGDNVAWCGTHINSSVVGTGHEGNDGRRNRPSAGVVLYSNTANRQHTSIRGVKSEI